MKFKFYLLIIIFFLGLTHPLKPGTSKLAAVVLPITEDAYTSGIGDSGTGNYVWAGNDVGNTQYKAWIKFSTASLDDSVKRARLFIHCDSATYCGTNIPLYIVTGSWTETGISTASEPTKEASAYTTASFSQGWNTVDITDIVEDWRTGAKTNYGLVFWHTDTTASTWTRISSRENTNNNGAYIEVDYGGTLALNFDAYTSTIGDSGTQNYNWAGSDSSGGRYHAWFQFDTSTLSASVISATLYLHCDSAIYCGANIPLYVVTATWTENGISYGSEPSKEASAFTTVSFSQGWNTVDITDIVEDWRTGTRTNFGISLWDTGTTESQSRISSRENANGNEAYIVIVGGGIIPEFNFYPINVIFVVIFIGILVYLRKFKNL
ncbi:MAG: DNRLRE domain-containing protein [Candidatus Hodarchaeales archaeon]|jgi:hypothetical protein